MSDYLSDFNLGDNVFIERTFVDSTGLGTAVTGGSACCKNMRTQILQNSGVGAITTSGGLTTLTIFTGSGGYAKGDYSVYMGAGTVSAVSVIGYTLAQFSIGRTTAITYSSNLLTWLGSAPNALISGRVDANAAAVTVSADVLKWNGTAVVSPATAGIPDVNAKNIGGVASAVSTLSVNVVTVLGVAPSTTADVVTAMTATTLSADVKLWQGVSPNALIAGRVDATVAAATFSCNVIQWNGTTPNNLISGRVDANANAAIATATLSANVLQWNGTAVSVPATAGIPEVNVKNINNVATTAVTTVKAVQGLTTADQVTTAVNLTTNNDKTGYALTAAERNSTADAFLLRDIATGASATDRNVQNTLRAIRNKTSITGSTITVFQEDDATPAWTAVTTTATAVSITSVDPV